jgi:hypothetical protein
MVGDTDVPREYDVVSNPCASRNSDTRHDQTPLSDPDVMSHLDQIVHLRATPDDSVVDATAIDAGVGTDLDLVLQNAATDVGDTGVPLSVRQISKTVAPYHSPGLQYDSAADPSTGITHHTGAENGVIPDRNSIAQGYSLRQLASCAKVDVTTQDGKWSDGNISAQTGACAESDRGVDTGTRRVSWV